MFKALFQLDWGFASLERKRFLCVEGVQVSSVSFDHFKGHTDSKTMWQVLL